MLCHVSAWWAQPPRKERRQEISFSKSLSGQFHSVYLFLENIQKLRSGDKMERAGAEVGELAAKKAAGQQTERTHPLPLSLSLALIHTHRGEKWLMINHLSQNSPITFPNQYNPHARTENRELRNKILNDLKPSFVRLNPSFSLTLCSQYDSHGFFLPCLLITQFILSSQRRCLCH